MTKKITTLTDAQWQRMEEVREHWLKVGTSTEPADFERAKRAIFEMYRRIGKKPPSTVLCGDQWSCLLWMGMLQGLMGDQLYDQLYVQLYDQLRVQLSDQLRVQLSDQLSDQLRVQLRDQLRVQLSDQLYDQLSDQLSDQFRVQLSQSHWGQHESSWIAFYSFGAEVSSGYGAVHSELLGLWSEISQSISWWWPKEDFLFLCDRPEVQSLVDGQLHCDSGPAIKLRHTGFSVWALRGVVVDEQIVMRPETQAIEQIKSEDNAEVKRLRIERKGWTEYLKGIQAERIDSRRNDIEGTRESLYRADDMSVLVCACPSTAKVFALEVPPEIQTCESAQGYLSSGLNKRIISAA